MARYTLREARRILKTGYGTLLVGPDITPKQAERLDDEGSGEWWPESWVKCERVVSPGYDA